MKKRRLGNFAQVIRDRRRQLNLTQEEIARKIKISTPYVGHLEAGKRNPSDKVLSRLARVLKLETHSLFLMANPDASELLRASEPDNKRSAWDEFCKDPQIQSAYNIVPDEMEFLSTVVTMGDISSPRDLIHILTVIRHVLRR